MVGLDGIIYSLQSRGGITTYYDHILKYIDKVDIPNALYLCESVVNNTTLNNVRRVGKSLFSRYRKLEIHKDIDVFFSSYYRISDRKIPNIVTVHDFIYENYRTGIPRAIHVLQKRRALENAEQILCVSETTKRDLFKYHPYLKGKKVSVVYNGVSSEYYPEYCDVGDYVLFVGNRHYYKNFDVLAKALKDSDILLQIVGGGALSRSEQEMLNGLKVHYKHDVDVSDQKLRQYYSGAIAFVYPSSYEGFGIPILEAFRCKCPVISVPCDAIDEISGGNTVRVPLKPLDILDAIDYCSNMNRSEHTDQAYEYSLRYDWDKTASQTVSIISNYL